MAEGGRGTHAGVVMEPPTIYGNGADAGTGADRGESRQEVLFGDGRWVRERLAALRARERGAQPASQERGAPVSSI